MEDFLKYLSP